MSYIHETYDETADTTTDEQIKVVVNLTAVELRHTFYFSGIS